MKHTILTLVLSLIIISCGTLGQVTERKENGRFGATKSAKIIKNVSFDLDSKKSLLLILNGDFMYGMSQNLNYFDRVVKYKDFELEIIKAKKQEEVGALCGKIGLSNANNNYEPFLYLVFNSENKEGLIYQQLKLINPEDAEELFVAEIDKDFYLRGVYDKNTYYPLFNSLIEYIEENSKTYNK